MSHRRCFSRGETWKMQAFSETTLARFGRFKGERITGMNQLGGKRLALAVGRLWKYHDLRLIMRTCSEVFKAKINK